MGFLKKIVVALNVLLVPTLNFRFKPETLIEKFENDSHSAGSAWKTKEKINTDHIGLRGILTQGLDGKALTRIKAHPVKATWGLIRLINPIGITIFATIGLYLTVNKASEHLSRLFIHPIAPQIALA